MQSVHASSAHRDHIDPASGPSSLDGLLCDLPPCDLVRRSRLHSARCSGDVSPVGWPLLITGTPRSATVYAQTTLARHGMSIQDDWGPHLRDGRVSWIHAFEDDRAYGKSMPTIGRKYRRVLHQVKEPLGSIASLCSEDVFRDGYNVFLQRHIPLNSSRAEPVQLSPVVLEFWVQWHSFLTEMRLPTYRIEGVEVRDIFRASGLGGLYSERPSNASAESNHRRHRKTFTWQELYTIDPRNAARAWELAHRYGYSYPDVDFDGLTCLPYLPMCRGDPNQGVEAEECPAGTHPHTTNMSRRILSPPAGDLGFEGWADGGCVEHSVPWMVPAFVGVRGLLGRDDLQRIGESFEFRGLLGQLNKTEVPKRMPANGTSIDVAPPRSLYYYDPFVNWHLFLSIWAGATILIRCRKQMSFL